MGRQRTELRASAAFSASANIDFDTPSWAKRATFYLKAGTGAGTSPTIDFKLQYKTPAGDFVDLDDGGSAQIATNDQTRILHVDPAGTSDTTGNERLSPKPLAATYRAVLTLGGSDTPSYTATSLHVDYTG